MADEQIASDVEVESQWVDEIAGLFLVAHDRCRRFAGLLRIAGSSLGPDAIEDERREFRRIIYRIGQICRHQEQREPEGGRVE